MSETTKGESPTIWVPSAGALTEPTRLPPVAVQLPAVFGFSASSLAFGGFSLIGCVLTGAFFALHIPESVVNYIHAGLPLWRFLFQFSADVLVSILSLYLISILVWKFYCAWTWGERVLTISNQGILDLRVSDRLIDWRDIEDAQPGSYRGARWVKLRLRSGRHIRFKGPRTIIRRLMPWRKSAQVAVEIQDISGDKNILTNLILLMIEKANQQPER